MKKVLILTSKVMSGKKPTYLTEAAFHAKLTGMLEGQLEVTMATLPELIYQTGTRTRIWHPTAGYDVADFDAVVVRKVGRYQELAIAVAHYVHSKDIPFSDSYLLASGNGKLACAFIRALRGLPVPETLYGPTEQLLAHNLVAFPSIVKADIAQAGGDNYYVKDSGEYRQIHERHRDDMMVTQPYIPNDGDYRILVMNYKPVLAILRQKAAGSHLNNTSMGGQAHLVDLSTLQKGLLRSAVQASRVEKLQVAGVDIMVDATKGHHTILEVNRAPQIPSGTFIDEKIAAYADFLTSLVNQTPKSTKQSIIGRAELVEFPESIEGVINARIDTGAKTSSVWGTAKTLDDGRLAVTFLGEKHDNFQQKTHYFDTFERAIVASSNGQEQLRYKIKLLVVLNGRRIRAWFTVADRSTQAYPVLIGRNVLTNRFIVDVSQGQPNFAAEKIRSQTLQIKKER
jgi:glutathione synthase/RimK-type ligase-like ATP-grasp enzyme